MFTFSNIQLKIKIYAHQNEADGEIYTMTSSLKAVDSVRRYINFTEDGLQRKENNQG